MPNGNKHFRNLLVMLCLSQFSIAGLVCSQSSQLTWLKLQTLRLVVPNWSSASCSPTCSGSWGCTTCSTFICLCWASLSPCQWCCAACWVSWWLPAQQCQLLSCFSVTCVLADHESALSCHSDNKCVKNTSSLLILRSPTGRQLPAGLCTVVTSLLSLAIELGFFYLYFVHFSLF